MNDNARSANPATRLLRVLSLAPFLGLTLMTTTVAQPALQQPVPPAISKERAKNTIPGQYIAVFKPGTSREALAAAQERVKALGGTIGFTYTSALIGFSFQVPADAARAQQVLQALRQSPGFDYVEADQKATISTDQPPNPLGAPPAGLDRIDHRLKTDMDGKYNYSETAPNVDVYVIDTGMRVTHNELAPRASGAWFSAFGDTSPIDCHGHGTHVAGTIGGATYGVAKLVKLHSVRVLDCSGSGTYSGVIAGVSWVKTNAALSPFSSVANMSLGGPPSAALNSAITNTIAAGVTFVVAAGNGMRADACNYSPAQIPSAITVGATEPNTDKLTPFTNIGPCVDIFAPGNLTLSAWNTSDTATNTISGTSMAAPHVAGAAARHLENFPFDSPAAVWARIDYDADSLPNSYSWPGLDGNPNPFPAATANKLLHWGKLNDGYDDGDPHFTTVDGVHYDFQGAGEFVTLRHGNAMQIQTRQTGVTTAPAYPNAYTGLTSCVSVNTAVAARVGTHRVTYQPSSGTGAGGMQLRVDGVPATLGPQGIPLGPGARVDNSGVPNGIDVAFPDGTTMSVIPNFWSAQNFTYLTLSVHKTPATEGIMGEIAPGSWLPALPNGSSLGPKPASLHQRYVELHQTFSNAWRVPNGGSLFDYAPGTSTATFTFAGWPPENPPCVFPKSPPVKPLDRDTAQKLCREVADKNRNANCIFDVAVTGEAGFAKVYLMSQRLEAGATRTMIGGDRDVSQIGNPVRFTAMVVRRSSSGRSVPAGAVEFLLDGSLTGQVVKLDDGGRATWTAARLPGGKHEVYAHYVPADGSVFLASTSSLKVHTVVGDGVRIQ